MKRVRGISMVEVLVALVVVAVLTAVAYPTYAGYITRTRRVEAQVAMIEAMQQQERYYAQHNTYLAFSSDSETQEPGLRWWSGGSPATSSYELDARACANRELTECVELRARPGTAKVDGTFRDDECGTLTLNSAGEQAASGKGERCWP